MDSAAEYRREILLLYERNRRLYPLLPLLAGQQIPMVPLAPGEEPRDRSNSPLLELEVSEVRRVGNGAAWMVHLKGTMPHHRTTLTTGSTQSPQLQRAFLQRRAVLDLRPALLQLYTKSVRSRLGALTVVLPPDLIRYLGQAL